MTSKLCTVTVLMALANLKGNTTLSLTLTVLAVVHAPRKYPIHIKDDTKNELDEMVDLGVIRPVTEPTDWVSSVAYSQKSKDDGVYALTLKILTKLSREDIIIHLP